MTDIEKWLKSQRELLAETSPGPWTPDDVQEEIRSKDKILGSVYYGSLDSQKKHPEYVLRDESIKNLKFITSVRTEHERALKIIEKYREALEIVVKDLVPYSPDSDEGMAVSRCEVALEYFPEES